jgi:hypothetical protein
MSFIAVSMVAEAILHALSNLSPRPRDKTQRRPLSPLVVRIEVPSVKVSNPTTTMSSSSFSATHLANPHIKMIIGPQPTTVRGAATHLGKHPTQPKVIYPSGKYVVVRDWEQSCDFYVYRGHSSKVTVAKVHTRGV